MSWDRASSWPRLEAGAPQLCALSPETVKHVMADLSRLLAPLTATDSHPHPVSASPSPPWLGPWVPSGWGLLSVPPLSHPLPPARSFPCRLSPLRGLLSLPEPSQLGSPGPASQPVASPGSLVTHMASPALTVLSPWLWSPRVQGLCPVPGVPGAEHGDSALSCGLRCPGPLWPPALVLANVFLSH